MPCARSIPRPLPATLVATMLIASPAAAATTRWANAVPAVSSQFSSTLWSASQVIGTPNVWPAHGDVPTAWAPATADGQREFIELEFGSPAPINYVTAFETLHPGAIDSVYAWNPTPGQYELLWAGVAHAAPESAQVWSATFPTTSYPVSRIRIAMDSPAVLGWNELDAVAIGQDAIHLLMPQWAAGAVASSSYHATGSFSATSATGPPNVFPGYGDNGGAWASLTADGGREWLQLDYAAPAFVSGYRVFQTFCPGAIDSIYLRNHDDGSLNLVYAAPPAPLPAVSAVLDNSIPTTSYLVDGVRLTLASNVVPTWNEIDAVSLDVDTLLVPVPPTASAPLPVAPRAAVLAAPHPCPFVASTALAFLLPFPGPARLEIFDAHGARVRTLVSDILTAGPHEARWDGTNEAGHASPPGLYFARLEAGHAVESRRLVRLR